MTEERIRVAAARLAALFRAHPDLWGKGELKAEDGRVCLLGGIYEELYRELEPGDYQAQLVALANLTANTPLLAALVARLPPEYLPRLLSTRAAWAVPRTSEAERNIDMLWMFNDDARGVGEVVALLERVAADGGPTAQDRAATQRLVDSLETSDVDIRTSG